ncbi:MAG: FG-GAP repeat domain-containing protein [Pyrinomonadaceae bacterium]
MISQTHKLLNFRLLLVSFVFLLSFLVSAEVFATTKNPIADFDGDGKSDISVYRFTDNFWYISKSSGGFSFIKWGQSGDIPVPGDYDGDGKTDVAVYREPAGVAPPEGVDTTWYILRSSDNTFYARQWGRDTPYQRNTPVAADYDGDGKTDLAVYTRSDAVGGIGDFQILQSSTNTGIARQWGYNTDGRVPADYDGDGKADLAVVRNHVWYILQSSNGAVRYEYFGLSDDRLVPADYDGDGKTDIAVWRPSTGVWYRINSGDKSFVAYQFGLSDDRLAPADYDGDGKADIAVFRPSTGVWYLQQSTKGFRAEQFGLSNDALLPNSSRR